MEDEGDNNKPKPAPSAPKIGSADRHLHKHSANEELLTDPKEDNKSFTSPVVSAYLGGASKEALDDTQVFLIELCMTRNSRTVNFFLKVSNFHSFETFKCFFIPD